MAPITLQGKAIVRELCTEQYGWDGPLPADKEVQWKSWKDSLEALEQLHIPRPYLPVSLLSTEQRELCVFSDASTTAISAVAYLSAVDDRGHNHVGFCKGKSKLAPRHSHTVPRLELCAVVLAVELADLLVDKLDSRSEVLHRFQSCANRRFYMYVANTVACIRKSSQPEQWHSVSTEYNPADHGTRPVPAACLGGTNWFSGPSFLQNNKEEATLTQPGSFELQ